MFFKAKYENGVDFQPKIYEGQLYYEYLGVSLTLGGDSAVSVRQHPAHHAQNQAVALLHLSAQHMGDYQEEMSREVLVKLYSS